MNGFSLFTLSLWVLCFCQGCGMENGKTGNGFRPKRIQLALVTNTRSDFWTNVQCGCDNAARSLGNVDVDFRYFTGSTAADQNKLLSDLVARRVDGIAISPVDAAKQTDFLNQIAAQTLLVCVGSDATNSRRACFIGTDNVAAGRQAADLLKAALPKGGEAILFAGHTDTQDTLDRIQGLKSELGGSGIQVIATMTDATNADMARHSAEEVIEKHPDLAGLVGLGSCDGPAMLKAVRGLGKTGQVKIVGFDDDRETLAGIAAGDIYGTVVPISTRIGYETVRRMDKYLSGDKTQLPSESILVTPLPVTRGLVESMQAWRSGRPQR